MSTCVNGVARDNHCLIGLQRRHPIRLSSKLLKKCFRGGRPFLLKGFHRPSKIAVANRFPTLTVRAVTGNLGQPGFAGCDAVFLVRPFKFAANRICQFTEAFLGHGHDVIVRRDDRQVTRETDAPSVEPIEDKRPMLVTTILVLPSLLGIVCQLGRLAEHDAILPQLRITATTVKAVLV